jgi:hypothetical protein
MLKAREGKGGGTAGDQLKLQQQGSREDFIAGAMGLSLKEQTAYCLIQKIKVGGPRAKPIPTRSQNVWWVCEEL